MSCQGFFNERFGPLVRAFASALLGLASLAVVFGGNASAKSCEVSDLQSGIHLITVGPGAAYDVPAAFGHTAVLLFDPSLQERSAVVDYGLFDPSDPMLVWDVITARQDYAVGAAPLSHTLAKYTALGRKLEVQRLNLTDEESARLIERLKKDATPGQNEFRYNWYRPNCTTRVADAMDDALEQRLSAQFAAAKRRSPAREVLRYASLQPWIGFGLRWGAGEQAWTPVSEWEGMYLPVGLYEGVAAASVERQGQTIPLEADRCTLVEGRYPLPPAEPSDLSVPLSAAGVLAASGLALLFRVRAGVARVAVSASGVGWGLFGLLAWVAAIFGTFAPYWSYQNFLLVTPLHALLTLGVWRSRRQVLTPVWRALIWLPALLTGLAALWAVVRMGADNNVALIAFVGPWTCMACHVAAAKR